MAKKRSSAPRNRRAVPVADPSLSPMAMAPQSSSAGAAGGSFPGEDQLQVDVYVCLLDAMTDSFPIKRSEIDSNTKPNKKPILADAQGWAIALIEFGSYLRQLRPIYAFYVHKPRYTEDTIDKTFAEIVSYLKQHVLSQYLGED